jgi:hypothetical protein
MTILNAHFSRSKGKKKFTMGIVVEKSKIISLQQKFVQIFSLAGHTY